MKTNTTLGDMGVTILSSTEQTRAIFESMCDTLADGNKILAHKLKQMIEDGETNFRKLSHEVNSLRGRTEKIMAEQ